LKKILPKLDFLDGFRAIGIVWVIWFHVWQQSWLSNNITVFGKTLYVDLFPKTGFLGVELLLFISGLGLFYSYRDKLHEKQPNSLKKYFTRRIRRILPSYILSILIIVLLFHPFFSLKETVYQLITHLLFIHNLSLQTYGTINGVFWVLAVEVQFYLLFPLIAKVFNKFPLPTFFLMMLIAIIYRQVIQIWQIDMIGFYANQLPGFVDLYAFGMLSAYILTSEKIIGINKKRLKIFATLVALVTVFIFIKMLVGLDNTPYSLNYIPIWQANNRQYLGLIFSAMVIATFFSVKLWKKLFANKVLFFISTISYNLFIWHQVIAIQLKNYRIPGFAVNDPHQNPVWQIQYTIVTVILSLMAATLITYLFEKPIIKKGLIKYFKEVVNLNTEKQILI
jgi:peptidoglycan/LPS O-acetylase OafA/YrhL